MCIRDRLKGTITSANMTDQTVTMRYAKRHAVKAVCIDEDGNTLKEPWVIGDGLLRGDEWDVTPPASQITPLRR